MKSQLPESFFHDRTSVLFTVLLLAVGIALLVGSGTGVVSLDGIEKFWPLTLVATGLVQLLATPGRKA